jgi:hypothetical protein
VNRNLAIDGHHHIVSDVFPEQPSARGPHCTKDNAIKWLQLVGARRDKDHMNARLIGNPFDRTHPVNAA